MYTKSNALHLGKKLFKNDGVPSRIVIEGAREQVIGKYEEAYQDAMV